MKDRADMDGQENGTYKTGIDAQEAGTGKTGVNARENGTGKTGVNARENGTGKTGVDVRENGAGGTGIDAQEARTGGTGVDARESGTGRPRYEAYVFDLYGTLIDIRTDEEDMWAWKRLALFYRYQGAEYKAKELKKEYEKTVKKALKKSAGGGSVDTAEIRIENVFRKLYEKKGVEPEEQVVFDTCRMFRIVTTRRIRLFPGVKEGLGRLKDEGARLYLLSNAQRVFTEKELEIFGLEKYFDGVILSSDRGVKKPDPRFFDYLIETYRLNPARTLMAGDDRRCDIEGAERAGMDGFFVGQGRDHVSRGKKAGRP